MRATRLSNDRARKNDTRRLPLWSLAVASLLTITCNSPESFRAAAVPDAGTSNTLVPNPAGNDASLTNDAGGDTGGSAGGGSVDAGAIGGADAPTVVDSDDAGTDGVGPDGGIGSGDGGPEPSGDDAAADGAPDDDVATAVPDADDSGSTYDALAQDVGGNSDGDPNAGDAHDAGDAGAEIPEAGADVPAGSATVCINAGGPAVAPCLADFGFSGGSSRSHPSSIDVSHVTEPAPAAVYKTARIGTFTYSVSGFAPGSAHLVRLHFVETYVTSRGQRVCDITSGAVAVLTRFDIFAAAGGANVVTIQDRLLNADASGRINLAFARVSNGSSCLVSAIEVR